MSRCYQEPLNRLLDAYHAGLPLVLLFDYDGTLTPLTAHPRLARLSGRMRHLLQELARQPLIHVGVISGRMIDDVKRMVAIPGLYYSGTSGLELDLRGVALRHPRADEGSSLVEEAAKRLRPVAARYPGAWVEQKPLGLTLHFRAVAGQQVRDLCAHARQTFRPWADQWRILGGPKALEATPALGWTKASAVRLIRLDVSKTACPFYAGDDSNDQDALAAAAAMGGLGVGVGPRAPLTAAYRLPDSAGLCRLLGRLLSALERSQAVGRPLRRPCGKS